MTNSIYKYALPFSYGWHTIEDVPSEAESIGIQVQDNKPVLYLIGNLDMKVDIRVFCGWTGMELPEEIEAVLGTAVLDNDTFVTHYFI